jgi:hypothetical protein
MNSIKPSIENIKKIYMSSGSLNMLLDFERVLDELDIYTFPHWGMGELIEGPIISKYWVKCKFMWPRAAMPDPSGANRLVPYGAKITYEKAKVQIPVKIKGSEDYRDHSKKGKLVDVPVWFVSIMLPKHLMSEIKEGSAEIAGEEIDLNDLNQAYEKDFDQQSMTGGGQSEPVATDFTGAAAPAMPGAVPNV